MIVLLEGLNIILHYISFIKYAESATFGNNKIEIEKDNFIYVPRCSLNRDQRIVLVCD